MKLLRMAAWIEMLGKPSLRHLRHLEILVCCTANVEVLSVLKIIASFWKS